MLRELTEHGESALIVVTAHSELFDHRTVGFSELTECGRSPTECGRCPLWGVNAHRVWSMLTPIAQGVACHGIWLLCLDALVVLESSWSVVRTHCVVAHQPEVIRTR